jgi:hypothetical protein
VIIPWMVMEELTAQQAIKYQNQYKRAADAIQAPCEASCGAAGRLPAGPATARAWEAGEPSGPTRQAASVCSLGERCGRQMARGYGSEYVSKPDLDLCWWCGQKASRDAAVIYHLKKRKRRVELIAVRYESWWGEHSHARPLRHMREGEQEGGPRPNLAGVVRSAPVRLDYLVRGVRFVAVSDRCQLGPRCCPGRLGMGTGPRHPCSLCGQTA